MSAMEWKMLSVDTLRPAAYNPRKKLVLSRVMEATENSV